MMIQIYTITKESLSTAKHITKAVEGESNAMHRLLTLASGSNRTSNNILYRIERGSDMPFLTVQSDYELNEQIMSEYGFKKICNHAQEEISDEDLILFNVRLAPYQRISHSKTCRYIKDKDERLRWVSERFKDSGMEVKDINEEHVIHVNGKHCDSNTGAEYKAATYVGIGRITDADTFFARIRKGIGKYKNYGAGLILIKKVKAKTWTNAATSC